MWVLMFMICPNCNCENAEGAKFCKKCGTPLKAKAINHENLINSMEKEKSDNTTKIIIVALVIVAIVLAGAFIYLQGFGTNDSQTSSSDASNSAVQQSQPATTASSSSSQPKQATQASTPITIKGGSFSTGSAEEDKTYASIYVGTEHSGENVIVQIQQRRQYPE